MNCTIVFVCVIQVVVGDQRGTLQLISMRKSEPIIDFKINLATPISSIVVLANQGTSHKNTF